MRVAAVTRRAIQRAGGVAIDWLKTQLQHAPSTWVSDGGMAEEEEAAASMCLLGAVKISFEAGEYPDDVPCESLLPKK